MTIVKNHEGGLPTRPDKFEILFATFAFFAGNGTGRDRPLLDLCALCS